MTGTGPSPAVSATDEAAERGAQLVDFLGPLGAVGVDHAVAGVVVDQAERDLVERRLDRADLGEHVDAVTLLLDHPRDPPHLPLDPREAFEQRCLVSFVADGHGSKVADTPGGY